MASITLPGTFVTSDSLANSHMLEFKADALFYPGAYAALRYDRVTIESPVFPISPLQRLEVGIRKKLARSIIEKASFIHAWNEINDFQDNVFGVQLSVGF